jgi:excisionase family DNA binding protein
MSTPSVSSPKQQLSAGGEANRGDGLITPLEVAARLGVSRTWVYVAAKEGRIPSIRIGGSEGPLRFVADDVDRWIDEARAAWRPGDTSAATLRRAGDNQPSQRERAA